MHLTKCVAPGNYVFLPSLPRRRNGRVKSVNPERVRLSGYGLCESGRPEPL